MRSEHSQRHQRVTGSLQVVNSRFAANSASRGGAIYSEGASRDHHELRSSVATQPQRPGAPCTWLNSQPSPSSTAPSAGNIAGVPQ